MNVYAEKKTKNLYVHDVFQCSLNLHITGTVCTCTRTAPYYKLQVHSYCMSLYSSYSTYTQPKINKRERDRTQFGWVSGFFSTTGKGASRLFSTPI